MASKKQLKMFLKKKSKPHKHKINISSNTAKLSADIFGSMTKPKRKKYKVSKAEKLGVKIFEGITPKQTSQVYQSTPIKKVTKKHIAKKLGRKGKKPKAKGKSTSAQEVVTPTPKTQLNKQIRSTYNYYKRQFKPLVERFMSATSTSDVEKNQITRIISESLEVINLTLKANKETEDFKDEVKDSLKDALKFLKDLESVGWSTGRYLHKFGFHPLFLPEDVWYALSSIKLEEALERTNAYIQEVVDYAKGNTPSAFENQEHKIRSRRQ